MGTKNNPGQFDCYSKALPDEPMFTILARDEDGPNTVEEWAIWRRAKKGPNDPKVIEAFACADAMRAWKRENPDI